VDLALVEDEHLRLPVLTWVAGWSVGAWPVEAILILLVFGSGRCFVVLLECTGGL
jgi:hypothetical protein